MSSISLQGLHHVYANGHVGLSNVDLDVHDGEFLALLGPSGSGKTTLLRSIAGFVQPEGGTLCLGGRPVAGPGVWVPPEKRNLGMVFQDHAIWPHWSVARNVGYPLRLAGLPRKDAEARVRSVLGLVGLDGLGERAPAALSGGQRQRVALARAIAGAPQALLLDEALSSLDEPLRARLRLDLKALTSEQGLTSVHVTHDRAEALALADRVAVLRAGRIEQIGTPQDLVRNPASTFVASFVSDAVLLDGTWVEGRLELAGGISIPGERLDAGPCVGADGLGHSAVAVTAAVSPMDLVLHPNNAGDTGWAPTGVVTSALYGPHGFDVSADWQGRTLRAHVTGWVPKPGDRVSPEVLRAHVFASDAVGPAAGAARPRLVPA
ncbi:ABC transporter ATP-binding protein [Arthrobacter caoxuetaonis]|uniref:ABC-type quaternary amine transporter n=1 Tax=Arthrobacter caoxuetaonis TaxID=2886935 RepID=A0A9X1SDU2_9MICC|nr:ABC transporter ATP-binding protein [Arthrobacter caoxuetaonis]MCC3299067.1 ABC transporter ATP-binding protein [Arthrobacter caoxuetaonis]USQ58597.1 ABC transporter ATP-binding protein [Arthrobacter caoxuetaonis]